MNWKTNMRYDIFFNLKFKGKVWCLGPSSR